MADGWVVDKGLNVLLAQINAAAPNRSKASDGSIGDADHSARTSDHNPESPAPSGNPDNQVDARDFTHDPANGADMGVVAESIRRSRDVRVRYLIWRDRICYPTARNGYAAWSWQPHTGDYHRHLHVSVNDVHNDETQPWQIGIGMSDPKTDSLHAGHFYGGRDNGEGVLPEYVNPKVTTGFNNSDLEQWAELRGETAKLRADVTELKNRPPVQSAPVDPAAVKAVLLDPEVLKAIGEATVAATRAEYND